MSAGWMPSSEIVSSRRFANQDPTVPPKTPSRFPRKSPTVEETEVARDPYPTSRRPQSPSTPSATPTTKDPESARPSKKDERTLLSAVAPSGARAAAETAAPAGMRPDETKAEVSSEGVTADSPRATTATHPHAPGGQRLGLLTESCLTASANVWAPPSASSRTERSASARSARAAT